MPNIRKKIVAEIIDRLVFLKGTIKNKLQFRDRLRVDFLYKG